MTLRSRIALLVAAVVTVVVAAVGVSVHQSAESELVEEIDLELLDRGRIVSTLGRNGRETPSALEQNEFQRQVGTRSYARVLDPDGTVVRIFGNGFDAPVNDEILAAADKHPTIVTGSIGDDRARVVTISMDDRGYVQIARSLGEIDQSLGDIRDRIFLIGALAVVGAAFLAWMLAARTARPIMRLTAAAEAVA